MERTLTIPAADGYPLGATLYLPDAPDAPRQVVIINCATGVKAAYYARYARYLTAHGHMALTYDYRGIGASRPGSLRALRAAKYDWGARDFEGVLRWVLEQHPALEIAVVGHSIGGVVPGFAASNARIGRMLTVGAQYAFWKDYAPAARFNFFWKWHVFMPLATMICGYFPGRRLGWLEDLPAGVALEWAFRRSKLEQKEKVTQYFSALRAPILVYGITDDPFGTPAALRRLHDYYRGSTLAYVFVGPEEVQTNEIGHFGFFHDRFEKNLWAESLAWLNEGQIVRRSTALIQSGHPEACPTN